MERGTHGHPTIEPSLSHRWFGRQCQFGPECREGMWEGDRDGDGMGDRGTHADVQGHIYRRTDDPALLGADTPRPAALHVVYIVCVSSLPHCNGSQRIYVLCRPRAPSPPLPWSPFKPPARSPGHQSLWLGMLRWWPCCSATLQVGCA